MRLLNASATENVVLALPGHRFKVIAMDGNPVPNPSAVEVLSLAVAERVDAVVEMNNPGVWILGSTLADARNMGLGIVVEYAGKSGAPVWNDPAAVKWDYTQFAAAAPALRPTRPSRSPFTTSARKRLQLRHLDHQQQVLARCRSHCVTAASDIASCLRNGSGDQHPIHLHRHTFEVTQIGAKTSAD